MLPAEAERTTPTTVRQGSITVPVGTGLFAQTGGRPDRSGGVGRTDGDGEERMVAVGVGGGEAMGDGSATGAGAAHDARTTASSVAVRSRPIVRGYSAGPPRSATGWSQLVQKGVQPKEKGGLSAALLGIATRRTVS